MLALPCKHWSDCWLLPHRPWSSVDHYLVGIDLTVDPEISDDILMGVFGADGVHEVAQDIVEQLNGIPVGRTGKLAVYIVRCP